MDPFVALFAVALVSQTATGVPQDERQVPPQFHGEWNENLADCGTGNNDSRLRIGPDQVRFYESGGRVRGAFLNGPFEVIIVMDMSGEGQTWIDAHHFTLASDGNYLSTRSDGGRLFVRYRCPATRSGQ